MVSVGRCYLVNDPALDKAARTLGGLALINATGMTTPLSATRRDAYADQVHFVCSVYREMLMLLLGAMGCASSRARGGSGE